MRTHQPKKEKKPEALLEYNFPEYQVTILAKNKEDAMRKLGIEQMKGGA